MSGILAEVLDNGMALLAERLAHTRAAAFQLLLPTGVAADPEQSQGISALMHGLCFRGAGELDARGLSDALDELGVRRGGGVGAETVTFSGALLADQLPEALSLYADIVRRPHLSAEELPAQRTLALQEVQAIEDQPARKLMQELRRTFFTGPHGRPSTGTAEGLGSTTIQQVQAEHTARYRPGGAALAVAGGFEPDRLREAVEAEFGDWQGTAPGLPPPSTDGRAVYRHIDQETAQEQIGVAYSEVEVGDPSYMAARLAAEVLSGGSSSRLFTEVREKRGLVYAVYASYTALRRAGCVMAYAGTTPERSQETLEVLLAELERLSQGIEAAELERARTGLLSALVMGGESSLARAAALASDWHLRGRARTLDEIRAEVEAVTVDDVIGHLQANPPRDFSVVTLGPRALQPRH